MLQGLRYWDGSILGIIEENQMQTRARLFGDEVGFGWSARKGYPMSQKRAIKRDRRADGESITIHISEKPF
jgi:hypothetical protein